MARGGPDTAKPARKVLLVAPVAAPGGAERVLAGLAKHLPVFGFEPHAVLLERGPAETWFQDAGCPVTLIASGRSRLGQAVRYLTVVAAIRRLARSVGASVILSSLAKGHAYGGLAAARAYPAVYWQHGIPRARLLDVLASKVPVSSVICSTEEAVRAQRRQTPGALIRKVSPGIDVQAVQAFAGSGSLVRQAYGWSGDQLVVGIVGRLEAWKGQRTFLKAAAVLTRRFPEARFAVVGGAVVGYEGSYEKELHAQAAELGISDRVVFTGHQDPVYPWYEALDVVVHASEEPEPFGLVLVEAMALGAALVATAGGGPLEIVENGKSGLLVPISDADAIADAVGELLVDEALRSRLSEAARVSAPRFSEEAMARGVAQVIEETLQSGGRAGVRFRGHSGKGAPS